MLALVDTTIVLGSALSAAWSAPEGSWGLDISNPRRDHSAMKRLVASVCGTILAACSGVAPFAGAPTQPADDCWFLEGEAIGQEGYTTLGELGMGGRDGRWDDVQVYAWITENQIDLWGGAEMTRAACTVTDDPEYINAMGDRVGWNEYPVINGMADQNDDPP